MKSTSLVSPKRFSRIAVFAALTTLGVSTSSAAQDTSPSGTYALTLPIPVQPCEFNGTHVRTVVQAPAGAKFNFVKIVGTEVVVQFLKWTGNSQGNLNRLLAIAPGIDSIAAYACLPLEDFNKFTRKAFATGSSSAEAVVGALILPAKLRPGSKNRDFDFSKDLSVGTTGGLRLRMSDHREAFINFLGGVGISSVTLTSDNTGSTVTNTTDRAAFTWTFGSMIEVDKVQLGIFFGADQISNASKSNWAYQKKPWYAIGLGYSLFGSAPSKSPAKTN